MALRLAIGAFLSPTLRRVIARGKRAILRSFAVALAFATGAALVLVSALLALSAWIGPIAATGIAGLALLMAASIATLAWGGRFSRRTDRPAIPASDMRTNGPLLMGGMTFLAGFALVNLLLRNRP